jgi:hypothetical protein
MEICLLIGADFFYFTPTLRHSGAIRHSGAKCCSRNLLFKHQEIPAAVRYANNLAGMTVKTKVFYIEKRNTILNNQYITFTLF